MRHDAITFGCRNKRLGQYQRAIVVNHSQQYLVVYMLAVIVKRRTDLLAIEFESVLFNTAVDLRRPSDFLKSRFQFVVLLLMQMNPVSSRVLGRVTCHIRERHQLQSINRTLRDLNQADTDANLENRAIIRKTEFPNRREQVFGKDIRFRDSAIQHQHAKLIPTQASQYVMVINTLTQLLCQLLQQRITRRVTTAIVYDLEVIQIQITQRMGREPTSRADYRLIKPIFKLSPIHQAGKRIVRGLKGNFLGQRARLADVTEHCNRAPDRTITMTNRRHGLLDVKLLSITSDE